MTIKTDKTAIQALENILLNAHEFQPQLKELLDFLNMKEFEKELKKKPNELKRYKTAAAFAEYKAGDTSKFRNVWEHDTGIQALCDTASVILLNTGYHVDLPYVATSESFKNVVTKINTSPTCEDSIQHYDDAFIKTFIAKANTPKYKRPSEVVYKGKWFDTQRIKNILIILGTQATTISLTTNGYLRFSNTYGSAYLARTNVDNSDPAIDEQQYEDLYLA